MKYRLYDIKYKQPNGIINGTLPNSIIVDLSKYKADVGFGNLNCRGGQAIKDVTGFEADYFKAELVSRYPSTDHKDLTKKEFPVYLDYERYIKKIHHHNSTKPNCRG
jgi:hypothetical protein